MDGRKITECPERGEQRRRQIDVGHQRECDMYRLLDAGQREQFAAIAGDMLARLGYAERPEYVVNY